MNFGEALEECMKGKRITNMNWNGNKYAKPPAYIERPKNMNERIMYDSDQNLTFIKLSKGDIAVADGVAYDKLKKHLWKSETGGYATRAKYSSKKKGATSEKMHTYLYGEAPAGMIFDHINGDRLDNRSCNLRIASYQENNVNRVAKNGTSKYKGVSWDSSRDKWISSIQIKGKTHHIGRFDSEEEAAKAYDMEAWKLFGNFAKLNFQYEVMPPRMYLYYVPGRVMPASMWKECHDSLTDSERLNDQVEILGHIDMVTADGKRLIGWLASQYDLQSEDWEVLE